MFSDFECPYCAAAAPVLRHVVEDSDVRTEDIAREFGGRCNLRFDDTNPFTEDIKYVEAIKRDITQVLTTSLDVRPHGVDRMVRPNRTADTFELDGNGRVVVGVHRHPVEIENPADCSAYAGRVMYGLDARARTPDAMRETEMPIGESWRAR